MMTMVDDVLPVIGVILMVAIVVILAAVIAAFVFGMAGQMPGASSTNESVWVTKELRGFIDVRVFCEDGVVCYGSPGSPSCIQNFTLADKLCNCSSAGGP